MPTISFLENDLIPDWCRLWKGPPLTLTLYIPTQSVGAVIGRKGATIASIQKQASPVRVSVCSNEKQTYFDSSPEDGGATMPTTSTTNNNKTPVNTPLDYSDPYWTPVVIKADFVASWKVVELILQHVNPPKELNVIVDVPIARQRHASIVGKRGLTLMQLSADSNCRIWIPPKDLQLDVILLEGSMQECLACFEGICGILTHGSPTSTAAAASPKSKISMTCQVQPLPSQTKLKSIGRKTSTIIKKRKGNHPSDWILTIVGNTQTQVQQAHDLLTKTTLGDETSSPTTPSPPGRGSPPAVEEDRDGVEPAVDEEEEEDEGVVVVAARQDVVSFQFFHRLFE
eukprot:CAMPEP_0176099444 /NCGR_PEP_ID=MMETSP0120_2-20121206/49870_1 /TAXON_ID=160619 /ORGANISM="Kryptoperidinium foliaceum, Strain CCMP 1326" /LENGTH=341 /DNA_ID=CAMNT_0017433473 /DNA_START=204 /DNA_END=1231 /DNA_ORIENTATION=+